MGLPCTPVSIYMQSSLCVREICVARVMATKVSAIIALLLWLHLAIAFQKHKEKLVIAGSSSNFICPFNEKNISFFVPSEKGSDLDVVNDHLKIPEVRFEHSGNISCSNGEKTTLVCRLKVIGKYL